MRDIESKMPRHQIPEGEQKLPVLDVQKKTERKLTMQDIADALFQNPRGAELLQGYMESASADEQMRLLFTIEHIVLDVHEQTPVFSFDAQQKVNALMPQLEEVPPLVRAVAAIVQNSIYDGLRAIPPEDLQTDRPEIRALSMATVLTERAAEEAEELTHRVYSPEVRGNSDLRFGYVSSDYVGVFHYSGRLVKLGEYDRLHEPYDEDFNIRDLDAWRMLLSRDDFDIENLYTIFRGMEENSDLDGTEVREVFGVLTAEEWQEYESLFPRLNSPDTDPYEYDEAHTIAATFAEKIYAGMDEGIPRLKRHIQTLITERETSLRFLAAEKLPEVLHQPNVLPFGETVPKKAMANFFEVMHEPRLREYIEEVFHFGYIELPIRTQIALMELLTSADDETFTWLHQVCARDDVETANFLKMFFMRAGDPSFGVKLLAFAERADSKTLNEVTETYDDIIWQLDDAEALVREHVVARRARDIDSRIVIERMIERTNKLFGPLLEAQDPRQVQAHLKKVDVQAALFANVYRSAVESDEDIPFDDFVHLDLVKKVNNGQELSEEITRHTKSSYPTGSIFTQRVMKDLQRLLEADENWWYLLEKDDAVLSAIGFAKTDKKNRRGKPIVKAGGFSVEPKYRGSAIGKGMEKETLLKEAEEHVLLAHVHAGIDVAEHYVEDTGFYISGVEHLQDGFGFEIILDVEENKRLKTKAFSEEELLKLAQPAESYHHEAQKDIVVVTLSSEWKKLATPIRTLTQDGFVGTRYFQNPNNPDEKIIVFERLQDLDAPLATDGETSFSASDK